MTLVIGGAGQGKLEYVLSQLHVGKDEVSYDPEAAKTVLTGLETWLRGETEPIPVLERLLKERPHVVILMDRDDRAWRERVGRTCCTLAERADCVIRMYCGIPSILKGEPEWN